MHKFHIKIISIFLFVTFFWSYGNFSYLLIPQASKFTSKNNKCSCKGTACCCNRMKNHKSNSCGLNQMACEHSENHNAATYASGPAFVSCTCSDNATKIFILNTNFLCPPIARISNFPEIQLLNDPTLSRRDFSLINLVFRPPRFFPC